MAEAQAAEHPSGATAAARAAPDRSTRWRSVRRAWRSVRREILIPLGVAVIAGWISGQIVADGQRKIDDEQKARDAATTQQQIDHSLELENLRYVRERSSNDPAQPRPFEALDLRKQSLAGLHLEKADFIKADLSGTDLFAADLNDARLEAAHLSGADLTAASLGRATADNTTDMSGTTAVILQAPGATLQGANLRGAILSSSNFQGADLAGCDLEGAVLNADSPVPTFHPGQADVRDAPVNLEKSLLNGAHLHKADLTKADLKSATGIKTDFTRAVLKGADLSGADLSRADLAGADLTGANLTGATLKDIYYDSSTRWPSGFSPPPSRAVEDSP